MSTRRFIAGAICPKCKLRDKIVVFSEEQQQYRECVECGFKEKMHFQSQAAELATRVNHAEGTEQEPAQIKIIDKS